MTDSLTSFLRQVGEERVTVCINGETMSVSKSEALARKMYLMAMGGVEEIVDEDGAVVKIMRKPDYRVAKMIREFTEGKPASEVASDGPDRKKPGAFNSSIRERLGKRLGPKRPATKGDVK